MDAAATVIPSRILLKWQEDADLFARIIEVPAALVVKFEPPNAWIPVSSRSPGNPYEAGEKLKLNESLYCQLIMDTQAMVWIPDTRSGPSKTPSELKAGMVSYVGVPIRWPNGETFGAIVALDAEPNRLAGDASQRLLLHFSDAIETDLALLDLTRKSGRGHDLCGVSSDVTEGGKSREASGGSDDGFQTLFEDSPFPFWELDLSRVKIYLDGLRSEGIDPCSHLMEQPEAASYCARVARPVRFNKATLRLNGADDESALFEWFSKALTDESQMHIANFRDMIVGLAPGGTVYESEGVFSTMNAGLVNYMSRVIVLPGYEDTWLRVLVSTLDLNEHKRAEEAIAHLAAIVESSDDAIIGASLDGTIVSWNKGAQDLYGYSASEAIGRHISFLAPDDGIDGHDEIQKLLDSGRRVEQYETVHVAKYGQTIDVSMTVSPITDANGAQTGASTISRDITARKRAEQALRQSQQEYSSLVNAIDGIVWQADARTFGFYFVSQQAERILGYPVEQWLNDPDFWRDHIHPDDRQWALDLCLKATAEGRDHEFKYRMMASNGQAVWLHDFVTVGVEDNRAVKLQGVMVDITDRELAQEALRKSEEEHRVFFELDLAANFVSTPEGRLLKCNPAFARMFGFDSVEQALDSGGSSVYLSPQARSSFLALLESRKRLERFEEDLRRRDGTTIHVIENVIGSFDAQGRLTEIRGYLMDDTERRKIEEQLRESQKLEAIGRLAGGIAHDFNNVLTVVLGYSQLMLRKMPRSDPGYAEALEIRVAGERAAALTNQLLAFSRRQILQPTVLNLSDVVANLDKMLRRIIGEDIDLITVADPAAGMVKADPGQIEQVIINLAVNARDAMPDGGRLTIETANVYLDESYAANHISVKPGAYVMVAVSDNGAGMDEEIMSHIFEPFFTTKESGKGTGLGLSTVYGIVKQSGGNIWVYSEPERGSTFKVYLPCVDEDVNPAVHPRLAESEHRGTEIVLLVEDETPVRQLAVRGLREAGYTVLEASGATEALRLIAEPANQQIEIVVTDVIMPGMGGKELADQVKTIRPDVKVLFVTGYTDNAIVHHGYLDAGIDVLQKPFTPSALARRVREVLDRAKTR